MKSKNRTKSQYQTIPEVAVRRTQESQPYEKASETPDKDTRGWSNAFTLIELLVVVLIIGILAAVAVPQYQKAVEKSKAAQAFALIRSLAAAQEAFYLTNNTYTSSFDDLAVSIPWEQDSPSWIYQGHKAKSDGNWTVEFYNHNAGRGIAVGRTSGPYAGAGFLYLLESSIWPTKQLLCMERKDKTSLPFSKEYGEYCTKFFPELEFKKS